MGAIDLYLIQELYICFCRFYNSVLFSYSNGTYFLTNGGLSRWIVVICCKSDFLRLVDRRFSLCVS
jgi:hypothetical protein